MKLTMLESYNATAQRISVKEAKRMLNRNGNVYLDEEVKKIVDYLYALAELEVEHVQSKAKKNASHCYQR
jgi:hypothetical protein